MSSERMDSLEANPQVPPQVAATWSQTLNKLGLNLDFSLRSLQEDLDRILDVAELKIGCSLGEIDYDFEACAGAYLGEVLGQTLARRWIGFFHPRGCRSYYTSS
ncbi:MAG: hypothetical protein U0931_11890 [Vulcanimicrobiota bacterium]